MFAATLGLGRAGDLSLPGLLSCLASTVPTKLQPSPYLSILRFGLHQTMFLILFQHQNEEAKKLSVFHQERRCQHHFGLWCARDSRLSLTGISKGTDGSLDARLLPKEAKHSGAGHFRGHRSYHSQVQSQLPFYHHRLLDWASTLALPWLCHYKRDWTIFQPAWTLGHFPSPMSYEKRGEKLRDSLTSHLFCS